MSHDRLRLETEREDLNGIVNLYRQSSESVETMNKRLLTQVKDLETLLADKDVQIKEMRKENLELSESYYQIKESKEIQAIENEAMKQRVQVLEETN